MISKDTEQLMIKLIKIRKSSDPKFVANGRKFLSEKSKSMSDYNHASDNSSNDSLNQQNDEIKILIKEILNKSQFYRFYKFV